MSMCTVISYVIGRGCLLWPVCSLNKTQRFPCFILYSKAQLACYSRYLLTSYFCIPIPYDVKDIFLVLILEGLVGLHRIRQLQLLWHQWLEPRLELLWFGMICLEMNWNNSVVFEIAPHYCILDSFVDNESYSISSKAFLPIVVDIIVIWMKFAPSCPI